jgi:hypothetical protein
MITFSDQQSFLQVVRPPPGYRLSFCFGTAFSLDLDCVVALARVAAKSGRLEEYSELSIHEALQGIAEFTQNSIVFVQACQIMALERQHAALRAKDYGRLISLLDQVVLPVSAPGIKSSFHPKVWLVRFDAEHEDSKAIYRALVTSRNLCKDMNWEIGCILEGQKEAKPNNLGRQLQRFILSLKAWVPAAKQQLFQKMTKDLQTIDFQRPSRTRSFQFLYKDLRNQAGCWIEPIDYEALIVVSPFISTEMISTLSKGIRDVRRFYLVTCPATAFKLKALTDIHHHCFVFDTREANIEGGGDMRFGLHAKIYIGLRPNGAGADVFLGSANCTTSGLRGPNTEAMIRLECSKSTFADFLGNFIYEDIKTEMPHLWLRKFTSLTAKELRAAEEMDARQQKLADAQSALTTGQFRLRVEPGAKRARLSFLRPRSFNIPFGVTVKVAPLNSPRSKRLAACLQQGGALFHSTAGFQSDFVYVELSLRDSPSVKFMTVAISNINKRTRNRAIIGSYLREPSAFFQYLRLILKMPLQTGYANGKGGGFPGSRRRKVNFSRVTNNSFLEEVLVNASHNQFAINQIQNALDATDRRSGAVTDFARFWQDFMEAHNDIVKNARV